MSDNQEEKQRPKLASQESYSGSRQRKPFSISLRRASYQPDDVIWPAPSEVYSDEQSTLPRLRRRFAIQPALAMAVLGGVVLLVIVALIATSLLRGTSHAVTAHSPLGRGGDIAQSTASVTTTSTPLATAAATSVPNTPGASGGKPVVAPTHGAAPPGTIAPTTIVPTATPPICNTIDPSGSPVTLFGDDVSGGSGSGATIGSLSTYLAIERAVSGNTCSVTHIQQIVTVNLNVAPETSGSTCNNPPYPCAPQGTIVEIDQANNQIVRSATNLYGFGSGPVSRNIYGGTIDNPLNGHQCVTGTTEYVDNFSHVHQGGAVNYCWQS